MQVSANLKNGSLHMVKLFFLEKLASIISSINFWPLHQISSFSIKYFILFLLQSFFYIVVQACPPSFHYPLRSPQGTKINPPY